jgi:hypothetical protein
VTLSFWRRSTTASLTNGFIRRGSHVLSAMQGHELVLFDTRGERYYTLNEVGSRVWELLEREMTLDGLVESIRSEYALPAGTEGDPVEHDVTLLLGALQAARLVAVADGAYAGGGHGDE